MATWLLVLPALLVAVLPAVYLYAADMVTTRFPALRNKRICLLIAHPDDEAMFFAPSVLALTRPETGNHVKILCLSSGNADGLGETRKKELVESGMKLGLRKEDDVFVVDSPDFPDSMTTNWSTAKISSLLCSAFAPQLAMQQSDPDVAPTASIDVLITFDRHGVSSHPNHISLYHGAVSFVASLVAGKTAAVAGRSPVALYTLRSVSVARKYTSFLDALPTLAGAWSSLRAAPVEASLGEDQEDEDDDAPFNHPPGLVFMSALGAGGISTAWKAMTEAHKSQMVWFRYGWIAFSRYMVMNDLRLEEISAI